MHGDGAMLQNTTLRWFTLLKKEKFWPQGCITHCTTNGVRLRAIDCLLHEKQRQMKGADKL